MRALRLALLLAPLAAACGPSFPPRSFVFDTRVLAIVADPLEVGPAQSVTLTAWRAGPLGATILSERWSFCPFSIGASAGYACAVPECEAGIDLVQPPPNAEPGASNPLTATPGALVAQCYALLAAAGALPPGVPADPAALPERLEVLFRYDVEGTDGVKRQAVQRLLLHRADPDPATINHAPEILAVSIDGMPMPATGTDPTLGATPLDVRVQLAPGESYQEGGRRLVEQLVVSFYSTAGRFDLDWANGPEASAKLKPEELAPGTAAARVFVVARDLRGGQAVKGPYRLNVVTQARPSL